MEKMNNQNIQQDLEVALDAYELPGIKLGDIATGSIEGDYTNERVRDAIEDLAAGKFHVQAESENPVQCIDGRSGAGLDPDTAGGNVLSAMVADNLTFDRFEGENKTSAEAFLNTESALIAKGLEIGGHTDDHAHGEASGCGANDRLAEIYEKIATHGDVIRNVAASLGFKVSDETHNRMVDQAKLERNYGNGAERLEMLQREYSKIAELQGAHNEAVIVLNKREGTTLDRTTLAENYGDEIQAFNVDIWAIENLARYISEDESEVNDIATAMIYYNVATGATLCGPNMQVVVLE